MLTIGHYLNYKGHFYRCVQRKTNAFFGRLRTILEVSWGFTELSHVTTMRRAMR